jgi:hypothetical protein
MLKKGTQSPNNGTIQQRTSYFDVLIDFPADFVSAIVKLLRILTGEAYRALHGRKPNIDGM